MTGLPDPAWRETERPDADDMARAYETCWLCGNRPATETVERFEPLRDDWEDWRLCSQCAAECAEEDEKNV